jgi:hypothetical protein
MLAVSMISSLRTTNGSSIDNGAHRELRQRLRNFSADRIPAARQGQPNGFLLIVTGSAAASFWPSSDRFLKGIKCHHNLASVVLDTSVHAAHLVLQPSTGSLEGVVDRKVKVCMSLIRLRRMRNVNLATAGQSEMYVDFMSIAGLMVLAWRLQGYVTRYDSTVQFLEVCQMLFHILAHGSGRLHPLEGKFKVSLHGPSCYQPIS